MRKTVWAVCISLALALLFWGCRETDPNPTDNGSNNETRQTETNRNADETATGSLDIETGDASETDTVQTETRIPTESDTDSETENATESMTKSATDPETDASTPPEMDPTTDPETKAETKPETKAETKPETQPVATVYTGPIQPVLTKPARDLMMMALEIVSQSCGYSLKERTGTDNYDCSGFVAVLLRDALGEKSIGWEKPKTAGADPTEPWDTARWRAWPKDKG